MQSQSIYTDYVQRLYHIYIYIYVIISSLKLDPLLYAMVGVI